MKNLGVDDVVDKDTYSVAAGCEDHGGGVETRFEENEGEAAEGGVVGGGERVNVVLWSPRALASELKLQPRS